MSKMLCLNKNSLQGRLKHTMKLGRNYENYKHKITRLEEKNTNTSRWRQRQDLGCGNWLGWTTGTKHSGTRQGTRTRETQTIRQSGIREDNQTGDTWGKWSETRGELIFKIKQEVTRQNKTQNKTNLTAVWHQLQNDVLCPPVRTYEVRTTKYASPNLVLRDWPTIRPALLAFVCVCVCVCVSVSVC